MHKDEVIALAKSAGDYLQDSRGREEYVFDDYGIILFADTVVKIERALNEKLSSRVKRLEEMHTGITAMLSRIQSERDAYQQAADKLAQENKFHHESWIKADAAYHALKAQY